jgi:hypothetical protein
VPIDNISAYLRWGEEALLDPDVRCDRSQVEALLADDFIEFGSSGLVWTRDQIFDLLATETYTPPLIADFKCVMLSQDVALVTYRTVRRDAQSGARTASLRSSIWTNMSGRWRLRFHQGTHTT